MTRARPRPRGRWWPLLLAAALVLTACSGADDDELTVFAAASLRSVTAELEAAWLDEHPDSRLTVASEASNVLAAQIAEGAPADVFLSADRLRPDELTSRGLTAGQPLAFARNRLTLVVPAGREQVRTPADLVRPGLRIVGIGEGAPIARYTQRAIEALARAEPVPSAFSAAVEANIVSREDNVRAALAKVELGEGDAAFVYVTDARTAAGVRQVPLPGTVAITAEYAVVQVSDRPAAAEFVDWLRGPTARAIIEAAGFEAAT